MTHVDARGAARQVDVSAKGESLRVAEAEAVVLFPEVAYRALRDHQLAKGDALAVARTAGIMAAKQTPHLIPLCHSVPLTGTSIEFAFDDATRAVTVLARAQTVARTGVEMEAMTAASLAALTLYDMAKSLGKGIVIRQVRLISKTGGKSGDWKAT